MNSLTRPYGPPWPDWRRPFPWPRCHYYGRVWERRNCGAPGFQCARSESDTEVRHTDPEQTRSGMRACYAGGVLLLSPEGQGQRKISPCAANVLKDQAYPPLTNLYIHIHQLLFMASTTKTLTKSITVNIFTTLTLFSIRLVTWSRYLSKSFSLSVASSQPGSRAEARLYPAKAELNISSYWNSYL